jgi:signal transduction histidine kinase
MPQTVELGSLVKILTIIVTLCSLLGALLSIIIANRLFKFKQEMDKLLEGNRRNMEEKYVTKEILDLKLTPMARDISNQTKTLERIETHIRHQNNRKKDD